MFFRHIHFQYPLVFLRNDFRGITAFYVLFELRVVHRFGGTSARTRKEEIHQYHNDNAVNPVHVEPWHFIFVFFFVHNVFKVSLVNVGKRSQLCVCP